jgi:hypothetical protein
VGQTRTEIDELNEVEAVVVHNFRMTDAPNEERKEMVAAPDRAFGGAAPYEARK